jgi:large subunit ribosomal protein L3
MLNRIFGKKIGMTTLFDDKGQKMAVTVVQVLPSKVLQIKTKKTDGYDALVVGFDSCKEKGVTKARLGIFKKANVPAMREMREMKADDVSKFQVGQEIGAESFESVKMVNVEGVSKGRGFAGVIKRHHFQRGRETHGNKMHREGGSIGQHTDPARVWKGKRMAGHLGNAHCTVRNIEIVSVVKEKNLIVLRGAVPGCNNRLVDIVKVNGRK